MVPNLQPPCAERRRLLLFGAKLGLATFIVPAMGGALARAGATQPVLGDGYAAGDGVRLYFVQAGGGGERPLMLFLHGHPDSWALYEPQLREFGRDHLAVAPNLRGYAPSDAPAAVEAYAMPRLLGDVHALLDHFGRERCTLVGNDWGGYVAWVFASAYPARVERLIILNAPHPAVHLREVRTNPAQIQASQYERDFHIAVAPYPVWYNYYRADPIKVPTSVEDGASMGVPDLAAHFFIGGGTPPATISLRVSAPTLVIWGMQDSSTLPQQLDGLEDYAPDLSVLPINDAGHYPMRSHAGLVNQAIRAFMQRSK
jgi:pimeloyl-ACP methyl ester carboxylesterase